MVLALIAIAHIAQADLGGGILQLAIIVGAAGQAIERVIGDIKLHHPAPDLLQPWRLRFDHHALRGLRGATGGQPTHPLNLDQTHPA